MSELYLKYEMPVKSLEWSDKMLAHVNQSGSHIKTCELLRLKALAMKGLNLESDEIEKYLMKSISLAQKQDAKLFELRACKALAELKFKSDGSRSTHDVLKSTYDWFEPDHESIDLKEVESILDRIMK